MNQLQIRRQYFKWLSSLVCKDSRSEHLSYKSLLQRLHDTEFIWTIPRDENRAEDGIELRYRFATNNGYEDQYEDVLDILEAPCSMLEMMVALAIRCEENIMDDPAIGDRTGQWFWTMITTMGLSDMRDSRYNIVKVDDILDRFLSRDYSADGQGGLFRVRHDDRDMRDIEIWHQLCAYLDDI